MEARLNETVVKQLEKSKIANAGLMKEGFKCQTLFEMMNNCADKCQMMYHETGIEDETQPGVTCYKNCLTKSYKMATQNMQQ